MTEWFSKGFEPGVGIRVGPPGARSGSARFSGCGRQARAGNHRANRAGLGLKIGGFFSLFFDLQSVIKILVF